MPAYAEHGECLNIKPEAWLDNTPFIDVLNQIKITILVS